MDDKEHNDATADTAEREHDQARAARWVGKNIIIKVLEEYRVQHSRVIADAIVDALDKGPEPDAPPRPIGMSPALGAGYGSDGADFAASGRRSAGGDDFASSGG